MFAIAARTQRQMTSHGQSLGLQLIALGGNPMGLGMPSVGDVKDTMHGFMVVIFSEVLASPKSMLGATS